uniref:Uncharacterized protein n=1 Tax=Scleropages formosus TaxID=113540 RepID=A0A8C9RFS4_SCLFO
DQGTHRELIVERDCSASVLDRSTTAECSVPLNRQRGRKRDSGGPPACAFRTLHQTAFVICFSDTALWLLSAQANKMLGSGPPDTSFSMRDKGKHPRLDELQVCGAVCLQRRTISEVGEGPLDPKAHGLQNGLQ